MNFVFLFSCFSTQPFTSANLAVFFDNSFLLKACALRDECWSQAMLADDEGKSAAAGTKRRASRCN